METRRNRGEEAKPKVKEEELGGDAMLPYLYYKPKIVIGWNKSYTNDYCKYSFITI